ncbi:DNA polymerase III subunit alpha [Buchananella hordeovulneris]|uniref:DNA polymerase III subunit alpha n=1 Tax=Buchananella hordeovulneris TaxID=52770 RepID=UPI000F5F5878|nr:DNA polymerase III subunit alpha [Buchananella hordeovulneris]RRD53655.1 DNA polymerase III subunit alpha [Buchananella hordeovulneris]
MAASDFVHLHVHTDYSMLDGAAKINRAVAEAARLGQGALAITDHGFLFGAYEFYRAAKKAGIKPIIGLEAYMTPGTSRFDKSRVLWGTKEQQQAGDDVSARGSYTHITLLSRTTEGMHNLFRMGTSASLEGQLGKHPRIDRDLLQRHGRGLIGTTGCPSGEVQTRLRLGHWDEAVRAAAELQDIFGKENFFVELMDHGLSIERRVQRDLLRLARHLDAPLLATNDSHYVTSDERDIQDAMLCINSGSTLSDPDRFKFDGSDYYLRSSADMRRTWAELPEACDNTLLVAEMCEVEFKTTREGASYMPQFPVPPGEDEHSWFVKEVERGMAQRFPQGIPAECAKQAEYEVGVITSMGFPGYFLVVADYIQWAKRQGIRVGPGRGSGAGSMVAYAMGITELNPLEHGLIFERFLNPERISMPDFDIDFDERRREEVIEYVKSRYGHDHVAQVVTYGVIKTKQALKDSARVLGFPYSVGDQLTKKMPPAVQGKDIPLTGIFDTGHERYAEASEFRSFLDENPSMQPIVELAKGLEGMTRQWGVHACAVIMSSVPLVEVVPLMMRPSDGAVITQFDYPQCEELGLLKMDFLGLRNLTVLSDALDNCERNGKPRPDIDSLGLDDPETYALLARGESLGLFQLDSSGMRSLLKILKPDNFADISALGALYRPGPMGTNTHTNYALRKNGRQKIEQIHPELATALGPLLEETYGLIVYQEQVMEIARKLAGFTMGQADVLRKAMGKKKREAIDEQFVYFKQGMLDNGFSEESINTLWEVLVPFSAYAFNKAHSAAYGLVTYWTAYMKAHYPAEYMAALLTSTKDNKDRLAVYLSECHRMGITVLPPDVNHSLPDFAAVGDDIRFGLTAVRNVGANVVDAIIETRQTKGKFTSFADFLSKVPAVVCTKRAISSLIKAGAFDDMGYPRRALTACHEDFIDEVIAVKRNEAMGQFDLFGDLGGEEEVGLTFAAQVPELPEWDKSEKLKFEREMLGLYVSDHPLHGLESLIKAHATVEIGELEPAAPDDGTEQTGTSQSVNGQVVTVAGLVTGMQVKTNKKGSQWALVTLEDLTGTIEVLFFPRTFETVRTMLADDLVISVRGRLSERDETIALHANEMRILDTTGVGAGGPVVLRLPARRCTEEVSGKLLELLQQHRGSSPVRVMVTQPGRETLVELGADLMVERTTAFVADVKALLGASALG